MVEAGVPLLSRISGQWAPITVDANSKGSTVVIGRPRLLASASFLLMRRCPRRSNWGSGTVDARARRGAELDEFVHGFMGGVTVDFSSVSRMDEENRVVFDCEASQSMKLQSRSPAHGPEENTDADGPVVDLLGDQIDDFLLLFCGRRPCPVSAGLEGAEHVKWECGKVSRLVGVHSFHDDHAGQQPGC